MNETYVYDIGSLIWIVSSELSTVLPCRILEANIHIKASSRTVTYTTLNDCRTLMVAEEDVFATVNAALLELATIIG